MFSGICIKRLMYCCCFHKSKTFYFYQVRLQDHINAEATRLLHQKHIRRKLKRIKLFERV